LLIRLRDARDEAAWAQFVTIYAPLIFGFARKKGLQDADAAYVTQDVLKAVAEALPRLAYDAQRGSFRGWLFTVVRNKLKDRQRRQAARIVPSGDTEQMELLHQQPAPAEDEEGLWQQEYRQRLFAWAAEQVKPTVEESTWQAFWHTAVEGEAARQTASELGLSVAAVYMAKSRVLARIREYIQQVQGEGDHGGNDALPAAGPAASAAGRRPAGD
jgi:RNA polymerase sigma-70 factor (ECF subfamily)